ncbi:MAG: acetyl-CoA carboxylase biotin carboxylase subunit, partial [Deltaproteobacteria bacterium]|nr:acetyl-CoA carboxylase biotin carboxylase subunit [Deltaproteobacteria bacterium]
DEAIAVMKQALMDFVVAPIKTTIPLYQRIMDDADFQKGKFDTGFIKKFLPDDDDDDDD